MIRKFLLFFFIFSPLLLDFEEFMKLPSESFFEEVQGARYKGPSIGKRYKEEIIVSPHYKKEIERCYRKVLNKPEHYSTYDVNICQGFATQRILKLKSVQLNVQNKCLKYTQIKQNDQLQAFCEGVEETRLFPKIVENVVSIIQLLKLIIIFKV